MSAIRNGITRALVAVSVAAVFAGCAGARNSDKYPEQEKRLPEPTGTCIFVRTIQDFRVENPFSLLVRTRATGWQYRVELDRRCTQLPFAQAVGWTSQQGRVCDYRHDAVLVRGDRCSIGRITELKAQPGETKPEEGKAEVEEGASEAKEEEGAPEAK